jgi:hypothetical protein
MLAGQIVLRLRSPGAGPAVQPLQHSALGSSRQPCINGAPSTLFPCSIPVRNMLPTLLWHPQGLGIGSQRIEGTLPAEWSTLTNLVGMDLSYNQLTGPLPPSWSTLQKIGTVDSYQAMNLNYNQLTGALTPELGPLMLLVVGG